MKSSKAMIIIFNCCQLERKKYPVDQVVREMIHCRITRKDIIQNLNYLLKQVPTNVISLVLHSFTRLKRKTI